MDDRLNKKIIEFNSLNERYNNLYEEHVKLQKLFTNESTLHEQDKNKLDLYTFTLDNKRLEEEKKISELHQM